MQGLNPLFNPESLMDRLCALFKARYSAGEGALAPPASPQKPSPSFRASVVKPKEAKHATCKENRGNTSSTAPLTDVEEVQQTA